jgi:exopolysaccharide biosynthesis polyprenyl glycosylphosphotransferase
MRKVDTVGRFNKGANTNLIHIVSDCIFGLIGYFLAGVVSGNYKVIFDIDYIMVFITFITIYIFANKEVNLYNITTFFYIDRLIRCVSRSILIAAGVASILAIYIGKVTTNSRFFGYLLVMTYIFMLISAFLVHFLIKRMNNFKPRTLLIGDIDSFVEFKEYMHKSNEDINLIGYVSKKASADGDYLGEINNLEELIHKNAIDQIYIMHQVTDGSKIQPYMDICIEMGVTIRIIIDYFKVGAVQRYVSTVGTYPLVTYHTVTMNMSSRAIKRIIDIIGSMFGIILFMPVMLAAAIAIKMDSKGEVIFKQERVGMNGRRFYMLKFRSMCMDAESKKIDLLSQNEMDSDFIFKIHNDPRVTKVGKFIRRNSIDELPQFFNVLKGDMSLVGTRPPTLDEVKLYKRSHWRRMSIKPGITGIWQSSGRSEITDFNEVLNLDMEYIDNWSVLLDFEIILRTVKQVISGKDAY